MIVCATRILKEISMLKARRFLGFGVTLVLLASASLATGLAGCGAADEAGGGNPSAGATLIKQVDLTRSVLAPLTDDMVLNAYPDAGNDAGYEQSSVRWTADKKSVPVLGYFAVNTAYTAAVTLTPKKDYAFAPDVAVVHEGVEDTNITPALTGSSLSVSIVFSPTNASARAYAVDDLDLTARIPQPATGVYPVSNLWATQYTGPVQWYLAKGGAGHSGVFQPNTAYMATATLTVKNEDFYNEIAGARKYVFAGSSQFRHDFANPVSQEVQIDGSVTVTMYFPATPPVAVDDLDLTAKIPAPVTGASPVPTVGATQYTGPVVWSKTAGGTHSGAFQAGTAYTATATLTAASGYAFAGTPAFTHSGAAPSVSFNGGTATVSIKFPATPSAAVTDLDLTAKIPAPVTGASPVPTVGTTQYAGPVVWSKTAGGAHSGAFQAGTAYTATATLTAASGYVFAGTTFTHSGAASAPYS
jgi:hypothetical protein